MVQAILNVRGIPDEVKEKIEKDWKKGVIQDLMKEIKENLVLMDKEKLEKLLKGDHVHLESEHSKNPIRSHPTHFQIFL